MSGLIIYLLIAAIPAVIIWKCYDKLTALPDPKYSTFWPRFWASFVDSLVLLPITALINYILSFELPNSIFLFLFFMQTAFWYFYQVYMHGTYGQTVGKMVCKVKILRSNNEENINYKYAVLRDSIPIALFLLALTLQLYHIAIGKLTVSEMQNPTPETMRTHYYLYLIPTVWFVAELVTMITNKKRRALHDFIAGTVVVRTNVTN